MDCEKDILSISLQIYVSSYILWTRILWVCSLRDVHLQWFPKEWQQQQKFRKFNFLRLESLFKILLVFSLREWHSQLYWAKDCVHLFPTQLEFAWIFPIQLSSSQYLYSFEKSCGEGQLILFCSPFGTFDYETHGYNRIILLYDFLLGTRITL